MATLPGHGRSLTRVRPFCSDDRPLQFLAWLGVQQQPLLSELEKRLAPRTVGNVLLNTIQGGPPELTKLKATLKVERMKSFRVRKEDDEDLRALAVEKAWKRYSDAGKMGVPSLAYLVVPEERVPSVLEKIASGPPALLIPVPPLPLEEAGLSAMDIGDRWMAVSFISSIELGGFFERLVPVLQGQMETLPQRVHEDLRTHWGKWAAQKRTGVEDTLEEDTLVDAETVSAEGEVINRDLVALAYKLATAQWGERGRRFLDALHSGKPVEEASKVARISRQTGHKYLRKLREKLGQTG